MKHRDEIIICISMVYCLCAINTVFAQENSIAEKVENLLARMTLEEKVGQLEQMSIGFSDFTDDVAEKVRRGEVGLFLRLFGVNEANTIQRIAVEESRLGIPILFSEDIIHGFRTTFPIPLGEACTWDPELVRRNAEIAAKESRSEGIRWTYSPMVDVARDARWGRIAEGTGEDPYLGAVLAVAKVKGFQGTDLTSPHSVAVCLKHYVGGGAAIAGKEYNSLDMSERMLREIYMPPFKAGVEAGALTLMSGFNSLNGLPPAANSYLLSDILRKEWGFNGFIVTDWETIPELLVHGIAADSADAAKISLMSGVDAEMTSDLFGKFLPELVRNGVIPESAVDQACRRILTVKFMIGLFEDPYTDPDLGEKVLLQPEHIAAARDAARKSIVLLKNEDNLLPLRKNIGSIALIGPLADNKREPLGTWALGRPENVVTVLEGIQKKAPNTRIRYAKGSEILGDDESGIAEAVEIAGDADVSLVVVGEAAGMSGEAASRTSLDIPGVQKKLLQAVYETGTPVVVLLMNGRPLTIPWMAENIQAILETWHLGIQAGNGIADVVFGDYNPSGKLSVTFPRNVGQVPIYYNYDMTGRPPREGDLRSSLPNAGNVAGYFDIAATPLFPFGYGLSYTTFQYSGLSIDKDSIGPFGTVTVKADIENTGKVAGEEIVQLYIRDGVASLARPVKELKGFDKVYLQPGQQKSVSLTLGPEELGMYDRDMNSVVEPGIFDVWVGWNSNEGLHGTFEVVE